MPVGTVIDWGEWGNKGTTKVQGLYKGGTLIRKHKRN